MVHWLQPLGWLIAWALADLGLIDEARTLTAQLLSDPALAGEWADQLALHATEARMSAWRGELAYSTSMQWIEQALERVRQFGEPQYLTTALVPAAVARAGGGDSRGAAALLAELAQVPGVRHTQQYMPRLPDIVRVAITAGGPGLAVRFTDGLEPVYPLDQHAVITARALLAEQRGDHAGAAALFADAARWKQFEMPWEHAQALLGHGRCLLALGRPAEAREPLRTARHVFTSLGAAPALTETDRLLAQATTLTA